MRPVVYGEGRVGAGEYREEVPFECLDLYLILVGYFVVGGDQLTFYVLGVEVGLEL